MDRLLNYITGCQLLFAVLFSVAFTGSNSQQSLIVSSLSSPSTANYEYTKSEKQFIPVAVASLTGFDDFGSSFSGSDVGWSVGGTSLGIASIPLQFQLALTNNPAYLVEPLWIYRSLSPDGSAIRLDRVSSIVSGSTLCFYTDKTATFNCRIMQSPSSLVDTATFIPVSSFPHSNLSNFALIDLAAADGGSTFALTAFSDFTVPGSLAFTQLLRLEQGTFVPAGGPYTWNDITPADLPPTKYNSGNQRMALGHSGRVFAAGYPSANSGSGLLMIYSIPSGTNMVLSSQINGSANSYFGFSVSIQNSFLAVGAPGINSAYGSVYIFRLHSNGTVSPICSMVDSVAASKFGQSIFIEIDSLRSPFAFHVLVTAPVMVLRSDQSFKYVIVAAIRVDLSTSSCSISGSIQWPTVMPSMTPAPSDTDTLTGVFSSSGQVVTFVKRGNSIANSVLQSLFCLPNYRRTSRRSGNLNRNVFFCQACDLGTYSLGGISSTCNACPLPDPKSTVVWGYACQYSCPSGPYRPSNCVFDCDIAYSRLNNTEWQPLAAPTCSLQCSAGYYNASGACKACPALANNSFFGTPGSCSSSCLATYFWADGSQVVSRVNDPAVSCVTCSEQNMLLGNQPPANGFWQDNTTNCTFACNLGYLKSESQCDKCQPKPDHSSWVLGSNCKYVCDLGYFGSNCLPCSDYMFASGVSSPAHSFWVNGASTCNWQCNSQYNKVSDPIRCCPDQPIQNAVYATGNNVTCNFVCDPGYMWSDTSLSCTPCPSIPANSTYTRGCDSACKSGYAGVPCVSCSDFIGNKVLPSGGVWNMSSCGLSCQSGYRLFSNNYCCPLQTPANAQVVVDAPTQCNFKCNEGYRWDSTSLSCSLCPGYVPRNLNNTVWGLNCSFICAANSLVPPNWNYFECLTCPDCQIRCLPPQLAIPADTAVVIWTFNNSLRGSAKCQWNCPSATPQLSGNRCCNSLPSSAYRFESPGSCNFACAPGYDSFSDPRNTQFSLNCVPCSMSYRAALVPENGFWSNKAPSSGIGNCEYICKSGFTMYQSNGTDICCQLPQMAVLKSGAATCNDWSCPSNTYKLNDQCFNISTMSTVCSKLFFCSQCLATAGCGWCDSSQSCAPGTPEGTSSPLNPCSKWKFGTCADDCAGRSCETCTNSISDSNNVKCSWCTSTNECIRSITAEKSCASENTLSSLETCVTSCSSFSDCQSCVSSASCTYCSAKSTCLSNAQYTFLSENSRRYNYFCDKAYGKSLPGSCPSSADSMYLILIVALGALSCGCFLWFLCSRSNIMRAICNCFSRSDHRDHRLHQWGDQEMGSIPYNGPGLDPMILQQFPLLKYQKKSDSNIKFQEDGVNPSCSVCLGDFEIGDSLRILPCAHSFHQSCIVKPLHPNVLFCSSLTVFPDSSVLTFEQDEWFKVGTDCPLCKADFKNAASPQADHRAGIDEDIDDGPIDLRRLDAHHGTSPPRHGRNVLHSDDYDEPPALPHPSSSRRSRYSAGYAFGHESSDLDLASSRDDAIAAPPPRSRRGSRRASAADINDVLSDGNVNIRELGRVVAVQPSRVRLPALQARSGSGAALSQPAVSSDAINASGSSAASSQPLSVGVSRQSNRGARVIQQASTAAYNTGPLEQIRPHGRESSVPRARDRMNQA